MFRSSNRPKRPLTAKQVRKICTRCLYQGLLVGGFFLAARWSSHAATTLTWDASTTNPTDGVQDGAGTWSATGTNWWNGTADVQWQDTLTAQFGGGTNTAASRQVTVQGNFTVAGLSFTALGGTTVSASNPGYSFVPDSTVGGSITIQGGGAITIADKTSSADGFITLGVALAGANISINRSTSTAEQFLQLGVTTGMNPTNTWTGNLNVDGGTGGLFVRVMAPSEIDSLNGVNAANANSVTIALEGENSVYTTNFIVNGTGSGSSKRGAIRFDADMTLSGTITMMGSSTLNFQNSSAVGENVLLSGGITESGGSFDFTKTGAGTMTLTGTSNYSGATIIAPAVSAVDPGTLVLDFNDATVSSNLLYNGLATPGALTLKGNTQRESATAVATLVISGGEDLSAANSQAFGNVSVTGPAAILVSSGFNAVSLSLGSISRTAVGSMLSITAPGSGNITTTTLNTLLGTWVTYIAPNGTPSWAGSDPTGKLIAFTGDLNYATGTNISALTGYTSSSNLRISNTSSGNVVQASGTTTINSISFTGTNADRTVTVGAGNTLDLGPVGGIQLVTGSRNLIIGAAGNAGTLTAGTAANAELFLSNYDTLNVLTVNSVVADNGVGAVNVELNGVGTVVLTGTNTYTGSTIVNSGTLEVRNGSALGGITGNTLVGTGATLQLSGGITINEPLALSGTGVVVNSVNQGALHNISGNNTSSGLVTLNAAAEITADAGSSLTLFRTNSTTTVITGSAGVTFGGGGTIMVNSVIASSTVAKTDSGTLILNAANTYTGSTSIGAGIVEITNGAALGTVAGGTTVSSGATLELAGGITVGAEILNLNGTGVGNIGALDNLSGNNSYGGNITLQTSTRIDSDSGTLTLAGATLGGATSTSIPVTFGGAGNIVVNSVIGSTTSTLTKDGTGTLTLNGTNTYTGLTTISSGTLIMGANNVLGSGGLTVDGGGTLAMSTFSDTVGAVTLKNGAITGSTGVLTGSSFTMQSGTVSAGLAGTAATVGLSKTTTNTVTLSGTNTYQGATTISDGRLILDYSGGNTVLPTSDAVSFYGGIFEVDGGSSTTKAITLGAFTMGNATSPTNTGLSTLVVGANTALTTASLTRNSAAELLIDLSAPGSSLTITSSTGLVSQGQIVGTNGSNNAVVMKDSNGRYDFAALGANNTVVRLNSTNALPASASVASTSYVLAANNVTFNLGASETISSLRIDTTNAGGMLDLNGKTLTMSLFGVLNDGSNNFTIANSGTGGGLTGSSAVFLYQFGTGTLTLAASVLNTQTFLLGNGLIDWTGASGASQANWITGATVRLSGTGLTLNNSVTSGVGTGVLNIGNGGILELNFGDFTRAVGTGTNNINFTAGDAGFSAYGTDRVVNLGGAAATLTWGGSAFLASGNALILGSQYSNATVDFQNGLNLNGGYQTVQVLSPNTTGVGGKISGVITGTGGLTKAGQGILNLAGANNYTGFTTINAGTLLVTGAISGSSSVSAASGAELKLSGAGAISAGTLSLADSSKLSLEIGTLTSPPITLTGNATITGNVTLALTLTTDPTDGTTFTLIQGGSMLAGYDGGARFVADGVALADGATFNVTTGSFSQEFQISYQGGTNGTAVTVEAVPEPGVLASLLPAVGLLLGSQRLLRRSRLTSSRS